jgi:hypothetical protein
MEFNRLPDLSHVLNKLNRPRLDELISAFPGAADALKPGRVLGGERPLTGTESVALAWATLTELKPKADASEKVMLKRLSFARHLGLFGDILTLAGSATVVAAVTAFAAAPSRPEIAFFGAVFTATGTAISLLCKYLTRDVAGTDAALPKKYGRVRELNWESQQMLAQFEVLRHRPPRDVETQEVLSLVLRANDVAKELFLLI